MLDQLTLGIRLRDEAKFDNFLTGDNLEVISSLKNLVNSCAWNYIYLYGFAGVGKSHLLQACCQYASCQGLMSFYLPLGSEFSPLVLENLDHFSLVCIDNIQVIAGLPLWEEALFHFYNRSLQNKTRLLIAGSNLSNQLYFGLADLVSRLASGVTYIVKPLSDIQKMAALQLRAHLRGFVLPDEVGHYLLNHYPRDMAGLFEVLEILDQASLEAQHRLTIPFVKNVLSKR